MKRKLLLKIINKHGSIIIRHGAKHDLYQNPLTGIIETIPRHTDIEERLAKKIIKNLSNIDNN